MKRKSLWIIALLLMVVGVGLCFIPSLFNNQTAQPTFDPVSEEALAACPDYEAEALRAIAEQEPVCLTEVPYGKPVDNAYFDHALFVGDSLTNGLEMFGTLKNATYFCGTSATAAGTLANPALIDTLSARSYQRVYLMLGINEMGTPPKSYAATIGRLVDTIRTYQPNADIFIQTILPVVPEMTWSSSVFSVSNIQAANAALRSLAAEKGVYLVDTYHAFADENGRMPQNLCSDGVHLYAKNYAIWCQYLSFHAV